MRFNDWELIKVSKGTPVVEGILQYMKPQGKDWYQRPYKERVFKLVNNLLFYYRTNELDEPLGLLVLENVQVAYEMPGPAFAFSLNFSDGKHVFACRCLDDLNKWITSLKMASYEYWKSLHTLLSTKISMKRGKRIEERKPDSQRIVNKISSTSTIFYTQAESSISINTTSSNVKVENLIEL
ncbi:PREDICTED: pleckstrin homology domain-containing family J member 1-like [Nicrophorus vespilloides]|uniref:Pleckstrin homology domain-containing family J member 1 n=1 Tax=Nicrophorus vespilloides TaxID=110193 RepID=A0ABM1M7S3_NICVS|nr:PREDICTED: pleckstrin homology domain-containing family J member 1-like [Nicrophorus vespilloides]